MSKDYIKDPQEIRNIFDKDYQEENRPEIEITPKKEELKKDDILIFANNGTMVLGGNNMYVLEKYYNDQLECTEKPEYDVDRIYRPQYKKIYQRRKNGR